MGISIKQFKRVFITLLVGTIAGCFSAVGFEIALEFDFFDIVSRDYKAGLWTCDVAIIFGALFALLFGHLAWNDPDWFQDLIFIDLVKWGRRTFKRR